LTDPRGYGISRKALKDFIKAQEAFGIHSILINRNMETVVAAARRPYELSDVRHLYSASKSFTSLAVGFAVSEGLISVEDTLGKLFPEASPKMAKLTVHHLLTMGLGKDIVTDCDFLKESDWLASCLGLEPEHEPGEVFIYDNRDSFLLSAIVQKVTGKTCYEYLKPRLFDKLEMNSVSCETYQGYNPGGVGYMMTVEDLSKLGLLCLQGGKWNGEQVIDPEWIRLATTKRTETYPASSGIDGNKLVGYGYQFWMCPVENVYRAQGALGQLCIVSPDHNAVVAMTGGAVDAVHLLPEVWKLLEKMDNTEPEENDISFEELKSFLENWEVSCKAYGEKPENVSTRSGWMADAEGYIKKIEFIFDEEEDEIKMETDEGEVKWIAGHGFWKRNVTGYKADTHFCMTDIFYNEAAVCGGWEDGDYVLQAAFINSPYTDTIKLHFSDKKLSLEYSGYPKFPYREADIRLGFTVIL